MSLHFIVLVLISSSYFVPVGSAARFSDAPPVIISDGGVPVNPPDESWFKSPEIPAAATATPAASPSSGEVGGPATFPQVNASRPNRELNEVNASVVSLAVMINKPAAATAAAASPYSGEVGGPATFPDVNASRPNREPIEVNASVVSLAVMINKPAAATAASFPVVNASRTNRKLIEATDSNSTESPGY